MTAHETSLKLYCTPRSHFSRKVRILLDAWKLGHELVDIGNVADDASKEFAGNPLMKVPTLVDGDIWLIDSDHIAQYLTLTYHPGDPFNVLLKKPELLNLRAVMNGIMAAEVELLLAKRTGTDISQPRYQKLQKAIAQGLDWLEQNAGLFAGPPDYQDFHLVCLWDHLAFYKLVKLSYRHLAARVTELSSLPYVKASRPA